MYDNLDLPKNVNLDSGRQGTALTIRTVQNRKNKISTDTRRMCSCNGAELALPTMCGR